MIENKFEIDDVVYFVNKDELGVGVVSEIVCKNSKNAYSKGIIEYGIKDFKGNVEYFPQHSLSKKIPEAILCKQKLDKYNNKKEKL